MAARFYFCFLILKDTILIHFNYVLLVSDLALLFSKTVQQIQREAPGEQLIPIYIYKYFSMLVFLK